MWRPWSSVVTNITSTWLKTMMKSLHITHLKGLELFNLVTNTSSDIISESAFFADHAMIYDSNIESFVAIIILKNSSMILGDYDCNVLYLDDLTTLSTSTICTGVEGYCSGNASFCQVNRPRSLLLLDGEIYVGEYGAISVLKGRMISKLSQISLSNKIWATTSTPY